MVIVKRHDSELRSEAHPCFRAKRLVVLEKLEAFGIVVSSLLRLLEANLMPSELSEAIPGLQVLSASRRRHARQDRKTNS